MAIVNLPSVTGAKTVEEVIDVVENMRKQVEFLLNNVENDNLRGVIKANKIQVGDITNLVINSDFTLGDDGWGDGNKIVGDPGHPQTIGGKVVEQTGRDGYAGDDFPVSEAEQFHVGCYAYGGYSTKPFNMGIRFMRPDGNYVWVAGPHWEPGEGWTYKEKTVNAPSGTIYGHVWFQIEAMDTWGKWLYDKAFARRVGLITFDRAEGGSVKLGEKYGDGELQVYKADGSIVGRIDMQGGYFPKIQADNIMGNVVNTYAAFANDTYYVECNTGNDANDGRSTGAPKKNLQALLDSLPLDLNGANITIRCKGTNNGSIKVEGFKNGNLQIVEWDGSNFMTVKGTMVVTFCDRVLLQNIIVHGLGGSGNAMVSSFFCKEIYFYAVKCYGGTNQSHGFIVENCHAIVGECHVYNITERGLLAARLSHVYFYNGKGNPPTAVHCAGGACVQGAGTRWGGTIVRADNSWIGGYNSNGTDWVNDVWTINLGEASPPVPPPATEQTLTVTPSTGDNYSTSGYWTNDEVKQGNWGYGDRYGLWYTDLSAVKSKTIVSATITVNGIASGNSGNKTIYIRSHNYTSRAGRPSGTPSLSTETVTATVANGGSYNIDITSFVQSKIASGPDRSLGIYTTGTANYMAVTTRPTITIRYS